MIYRAHFAMSGIRFQTSVVVSESNYYTIIVWYESTSLSLYTIVWLLISQKSVKQFYLKSVQLGTYNINNGNNKITELRAILQRESQNS